jgi:hypothetical protein
MEAIEAITARKRRQLSLGHFMELSSSLNFDVRRPRVRDRKKLNP